MTAMDNLEQSVFINDEVRLGEDVESTQHFTSEIADRLGLLQSIHGEIEKVVKVSAWHETEKHLKYRIPPYH